jgi:hypothetical protein
MCVALGHSSPVSYTHVYCNCSDNRWLAILLRIWESLVQASGQRTPVLSEVSRGFTQSSGEWYFHIISDLLPTNHPKLDGLYPELRKKPLMYYSINNHIGHSYTYDVTLRSYR